jgi:hypothetical protein
VVLRREGEALTFEWKSDLEPAFGTKGMEIVLTGQDFEVIRGDVLFHAD